MTITDEIRKLIIARANTREMGKIAIGQGMRTLAHGALDRVREGLSTFEQVLSDAGALERMAARDHTGRLLRTALVACIAFALATSWLRRYETCRPRGAILCRAGGLPYKSLNNSSTVCFPIKRDRQLCVLGWESFFWSAPCLRNPGIRITLKHPSDYPDARLSVLIRSAVDLAISNPCFWFNRNTCSNWKKPAAGESSPPSSPPVKRTAWHCADASLGRILAESIQAPL